MQMKSLSSLINQNLSEFYNKEDFVNSHGGECRLCNGECTVVRPVTTVTYTQRVGEDYVLETQEWVPVFDDYTEEIGGIDACPACQEKHEAMYASSFKRGACGK